MADPAPEMARIGLMAEKTVLGPWVRKAFPPLTQMTSTEDAESAVASAKSAGRPLSGLVGERAYLADHVSPAFPGKPDSPGACRQISRFRCGPGIPATDSHGKAVTALRPEELQLQDSRKTRLCAGRVATSGQSQDSALRPEELQLQDNRRTRRIAFLTSEGSAQPAAGQFAKALARPSEEVRDEYAVILLDWRPVPS